jgi:hypothetical protein
MLMHCVVGSSTPGVLGDPDRTCTAMCMLWAPVWMSRASTSTTCPIRIGRKKWIPPEYTARASPDDQPTAHAYAVSSIQPMTVPPWALPPQFAALGAARNRNTVRGVVPSSEYRWRPWRRGSRGGRRGAARHVRFRTRSASVEGVHSGTARGEPSSSTATKTRMQCMAGVYRGSARRPLDDDEHLHARAARVDDARVRLDEFPARIGAVKCTLPT